MKRIALAVLIVLMGMTGFAQMITQANPTKKKVVIKKSEPQQPQSAVVDFSSDPSKAPDPSQGNVVYGIIDANGDTTLLVILPEVDIDLMQRYFQITDSYSGRRLVDNVRKVYPYAKLAGEKMHEYDSILANTPDEAERDRLMEQVEQELTDQYTAELKNLTITQGIILVRLIDRETGDTSYEVVKELRGRLRAFFYQGIARLWGYNLKTKYDPHTNPEDDDIETIMTLLDRGAI